MDNLKDAIKNWQKASDLDITEADELIKMYGN
jgi:hypothetical protein